MSDNLRPCPYCGTRPQEFENDQIQSNFVWCVNRECVIGYGWPMPVKLWNTRPIEDKLCAELTKAQNKIEELTEGFSP